MEIEKLKLKRKFFLMAKAPAEMMREFSHFMPAE